MGYVTGEVPFFTHSTFPAVLLVTTCFVDDLYYLILQVFILHLIVYQTLI